MRPGRDPDPKGWSASQQKGVARPTPHYGCARQRGDGPVPCACPPTADRMTRLILRKHWAEIEIRLAMRPRKGPWRTFQFADRGDDANGLLTSPWAATILAGSKSRL